MITWPLYLAILLAILAVRYQVKKEAQALKEEEKLKDEKSKSNY